MKNKKKAFRKIIRPIATLVLALLMIVPLAAGCGKKPADEVQPTSEAQSSEAADTAAVSIETVTTEDFSMDYCRFGKGERVLAILPGLSIQNVLGSADAIAEAYQPFVDEFTVYVFERRNALPEEYTVADMSADTAAAFEALGLKNVDIFGASYGGMAAMEIAIDHPELVDKIILASASVSLTDEEYQTVENWVSLAKEGKAEELYLAFGEAIYPDDVFEQSRDLLIDAAKSVTEEDLQRFIILSEGMKGFTITEKLDQIQCPVFAIGDKQDKVLGPQATENIGKALENHPGFELYMYDGYGHAVYDMAPDFKERMLAFLDKASPETEARISYLGPEGTYTEEAAQFFFAAGNFQPKETVPEAIADLVNGNADYAVIPQENTLGGAVTNYIDALIAEQNVYVIGEVILPINQTLMGLPGATLEDIKTVCSHAQGLTQSETWRKEHLPNAAAEEMASTAAAASYVAETGDKTIAAVAAPGAAKLYGLEVLAENVQITDTNKTRFYVLSTTGLKAEEQTLTNAVFVASCEANRLDDIIIEIHNSGAELVTIHDRPEGSQLGSYNYIIEVNNQAGLSADVLAKIDDIPEVHCLGSFNVVEKQQ